MLPRKNTVVFEELAPLLNDEQLWAYFEDTTTCEALPDSSTRFSASYRQLIYLLKLQKDDELQDLLTSKQFAAWKQFAEQYPGRGDAALNPADKFAVWAAKESLPDPVKAAAHALFNMRSDPVAKAQYNLDLFPTTWSKDLQVRGAPLLPTVSDPCRKLLSEVSQCTCSRLLCDSTNQAQWL